MVKALVLDFDGTLRPVREPRVRPVVADALRRVQAAGVQVILATGRSRHAVPTKALRGIRFDGMICVNGAQIVDGKNNIIAENTMTSEEMYALVDWCEDYEYELAFTYDDAYYAYLGFGPMRHYYTQITGDGSAILDGEDMNRHLDGMPYGAFGTIPPEGVEGFQEKYGYLGLRFLPYEENHYDIVHPGLSKAEGLRMLCEKKGWDPSEVVAVGDGSNDVEMLQLAGLGVAMGNASPLAIAAADRVTLRDEEDGVAVLCRELFPEAFRD